jgi:putative CocE/NonD family hydrolase
VNCSAIVPVADGVDLCKNVMIPMRDGVRLAADLYVPARQEPGTSYPVVMEYIPYRKDEISPEGPSHYTYLPRHGYVMARVDIRGTGASEGVYTDEYLLQEQFDGYDAIEWLAAQPWCDGHVNMMGISYGGFSSLQVASHNPPHLTSIIPVDFTDDRYTDDCHFRGGLLRKYYDVGFYGGFMVAWNAMPPYPEWSASSWAEVWEQHLAHNEPSLLKWFHNQTDGPYWRHGSVRDIPETIKCPVFMIGGWRDGYPNPPLRLYQLLQSPRKVLIGPWNHAMPDKAIPGPRVDYLNEVVRWLDHWCKGEDTGIMDEAPVTVFMQHGQSPVVDRLESAGEWRAESAWPPPGAEEKILYLGSENCLAAEPGEEGSELLAYEPTVGVTAGLWSGGIQFGLPGDQRPDEALSLVYTSPVLEEAVHVLGWPRAILHLSSSASVIGFAASLSDVAPDGSSHLVAKGMLNAARRESFADPKPLVPGEVYELDIQIDCTGWVFAPGHRIRLSIACADWPNVWPTPELGTSQVYRGRYRPSRLVLPTVPAAGSAVPPAFVPSAHAIKRHSDAASPPTWEVTKDVLTGNTSVRICVPISMRINDRTVVERESGTICRVAPGDPAHASARGWHVHRIVRPNQVVQGRADVLIQATATHFHITIDLEVRINDAPHFSRRWVETVERQLL